MLHESIVARIEADPQRALLAWAGSLRNAVRRGNDLEIAFILAVLTYVWARLDLTHITLNGE